MIRPLALLSFFTALASAETDTTAQNATVFALEYGYPLIQYDRLIRPILSTNGSNHLYNARELTIAADRTLDTPNHDTLYSKAALDLSRSNVIINIPTIPDGQDVIFSIYDPYGEDIFNAQTEDPHINLPWIIRQKPANSTDFGPESCGTSLCINLPSTYGIFFIRWLINSTNIDLVHSLQDKVAISTTNQYFLSSDAIPLAQMPSESATKSFAENTLDLLAAYAPSAYPLVYNQLPLVVRNLSAAGIQDGIWRPPANINLTLANTTAIQASARSVVTKSQHLNNDWVTLRPNMTGTYGSDYALRAYVAFSGYLLLTSPVAVYPNWLNASDPNAVANEVTINPGESLLYTFSGKPPLQDLGFWSLTLYGEDNFFVANPQNIYSLGDRSNLTYPSGENVYGPEAGEDGSFQILIQAMDHVPPTNWTNNWIPSSSGGGQIRALLRWYGAQESLLNGSYVYPLVTRQAALGSGLNSTSNNNGTGRGNGTMPLGTAAGLESGSKLSILLTSLLVGLLCGGLM